MYGSMGLLVSSLKTENQENKVCLMIHLAPKFDFLKMKEEDESEKADEEACVDYNCCCVCVTTCNM